ncbi:hypothetical protein [Flavobacterium agricola]|nr:hypothetical protein [Flavobacterium agricola]
MTKKTIQPKMILYTVLILAVLAFIMYKIAHYIGIFEAQNSAL